MYGQKLIDASGTTPVSLRTWRHTRPLFAKFVEAYCSYTSGFRHFRLGTETPGGDYTETDVVSPGLVLLDEHGSELWLSGCGSGYVGQGPAGAGYILYREGFDHAHVDLVPSMENLHIRKGLREPLLAVRRSELGYSTRPWALHIKSLIDTGYFEYVDQD